MSRTDLIERELLQALGNGSVEEVLQRHSDSKSVIYAALARVIPVAKKQLATAGHERKQAEEEGAELRSTADQLLSEAKRLSDEVAAKKRELEEIDGQVESRRELLRTADELEAAGWTQARLQDLRNAIANADQAQMRLEQALGPSDDESDSQQKRRKKPAKGRRREDGP